MFTEGTLEVARQIMTVWWAVAVVLLCIILGMVLRMVMRVTRMTAETEHLYTKTLQLLLLPVEGLYRFFTGRELDK